jgi:hypothetical protein
VVRKAASAPSSGAAATPAPNPTAASRTQPGTASRFDATAGYKTLHRSATANRVSKGAVPLSASDDADREEEAGKVAESCLACKQKKKKRRTYEGHECTLVLNMKSYSWQKAIPI